MKVQSKNLALKLCVTAMFAAILVCGKLALAAIPNVEVVTLFIALCSYVFGLWVAVPAVFAFIAVDLAIWGMGTWVFSYLVHWNVVALAFWVLSKFKLKNWATVVASTVLAVVLTALFGVLTSAMDTLVGFTGKGFYFVWADFFPRFATMYVLGISFYVTHVVCNAVLFASAFLPMVAVCQRAKTKMFPEISD